MIAELQARQAKLENTLRWLNRTPDLREGYCRCGCGATTSVPKASDANRGVVRGVPRLHVKGHANRKLQSVCVDLKTGCWNWVKVINHGYGASMTLTDRGYKPRHAHRLVWQRVNGLVPEGLELDHKCRNRKCVNPLHLRPVTSAENSRCGAKAKLKPTDIPNIRSLAASGLSFTDISRQYGVTGKCISAVVYGSTWRDIE